VPSTCGKGYEFSGSIRVMKFLDQLSNHQFVKDCLPRTWTRISRAINRYCGWSLEVREYGKGLGLRDETILQASPIRRDSYRISLAVYAVN
jgi:hypothetical protein